jgi:hypothetical protein
LEIVDSDGSSIVWRYLVPVIVERADGYCVISGKTKKKLGGRSKTRAEAEKRLRQMEFFKQRKGSWISPRALNWILSVS